MRMIRRFQQASTGSDVVELVRLWATRLPARIDLFDLRVMQLPPFAEELETSFVAPNEIMVDEIITDVRLAILSGSTGRANDEDTNRTFDGWRAQLKVGDRNIFDEPIRSINRASMKLPMVLTIQCSERVSFFLYGPTVIDAPVRIELDLIGYEKRRT
jgi:hypothetical protein